MPNRDATLVTTTVQLPHALWTRARTRAAEQRENLRAVIVRALERELARPVRHPRSPRHRATKTVMAALLCTGALFGAVVASPALAIDPEAACAAQDGHRLGLKPGVGVLHLGEDLFTRRAGGERIASCEIRTHGRTIFQRYEGGKVIERGFFLQGKRSGRWTSRGVSTIYVAGTPIRERPASVCDPVAKIGGALTVYCPRETPLTAMRSDFTVWDRVMPGAGRVFDVYSSEARTPDSDAAFKAFPEHSEINWAEVWFTQGKLTSFRCIPPGEKRLRSCLGLVGGS